MQYIGNPCLFMEEELLYNAMVNELMSLERQFVYNPDCEEVASRIDYLRATLKDEYRVNYN